MNGIGQRQAVAADLVAIGVIGEGGVDDAAGDRRHRMREGLPRLGIAVIADIRLDQDVADIVIGEALGDIDADLCRRQPAQRIIGEGLAERGLYSDDSFHK